MWAAFCVLIVQLTVIFCGPVAYNIIVSERISVGLFAYNTIRDNSRKYREVLP